MRRVSKDTSVSDSRWIRHKNGWRLEEDQVTERVWCDRRRELPGWRNGAKVYKAA